MAVSFLDKWRRVTRTEPCPVCGKPDWCLTARDDSGALCMRRESPHPRQGGGWYHSLTAGPGSWLSQALPVPPLVERSLKRHAPLEVLDQVHRALQGLLSLSGKHHGALLARGMSEAEIMAGGYRTLSRAGRGDVARQLADLFSPGVLTSVPGFYVEDNGRSAYLTIAGPAGLLLSCHDVEGRITGFQIRPDRQNGPKYLPFTSHTESKPRRGGTPTSMSLLMHVARPSEITSPAIWITEGVIKADIAACRLGAPVISTPGVASWRVAGVVEATVKLAKLTGADAVIVAYDADKVANPAVAQAEAGLCRTLREAGFTVRVAQWNPKEGKGVDDLLIAGGRYVLATPEERETSSRLPARVIETDAANQDTGDAAADYLTVEEVRGYISETAAQLLEEGVPGLHIFDSAPGTGKTTSVLNALVELWEAGGLVDWRDRVPVRRRVLFLTDTKEKIAELLAAMPRLRELAAVREGRSEDPQSLWYCTRKAEIDELGRARHNASAELCRQCFEQTPCCPYMHSKETANRRSIVLAPKAVAFRDPSFITGRDGLPPFSAVLVDEGLAPYLVDDVSLTRQDLNVLEEAMDRSGVGEGSAYRLLAQLLKGVIERGERPKARPCWYPLLPWLREVAEEQRLSPDRLVEQGYEEKAVMGTGDENLLIFEETFYRHGVRVVPLRVLGDLMERLRIELDRPPGADTALWLSFAYQGTASRVHLLLKQTRIIQTLSSILVLNLDTHPDTHALSLVFPHFQEHRWPVKQYLHVTQFCNSTYSRTLLMAHRSCREDLQRLIRFYRLIEDQVLTITHKSLLAQQALESEHVLVSSDSPFAETTSADREEELSGWWGKHHRALNRFSDVDAVVIASYFCENLGTLRARVHTLRDSAVPGRLEERSTGDYRLYEGFSDEKGKGRARLVPIDPDPDLQAAIDFSWSSAVHQAIGRGRPILRGPQSPLRVFILSAVPVKGLKVNELQSTSDILGKDHPVRELNQGKQDDAVERVRAAIETLLAEGKQPTVNAIYTRFGGRWSTIKRVIENYEQANSRRL